MKTISILFLGASRLVGLFERFHAAAALEGVRVDLISIEDPSPWHAIGVAGVGRVVAGPRFTDPSFWAFLKETVTKNRIDAVLATVDSGTIALATHANELEQLGVRVWVSSAELCRQMYDKVLADAWFRAHGLPVPDGDRWPRIAKPRFGSSGKGQVLLRDSEELAFWSSRNPSEEYLIQPYIKGAEYSVDAFVAYGSRLLGAVVRERIVISGGEVMVSQTVKKNAVIDLAHRILAFPGWLGPLNIQIMLAPEGPYVLEVNPRFGSGVTLAIEAGLDCPRWIIRSCLGRVLPDQPISWPEGLCMTRVRKDYFLWLSSSTSTAPSAPKKVYSSVH